MLGDQEKTLYFNRTTLEQQKNKVYSFRCDKVPKLFQQVLKSGKLLLQPITRPKQADKTDDPTYFPYHRFLGHTIENCYPLKNWLEKAIKDGVFILSDKAKAQPDAKKSNIFHSQVHPSCSCPKPSLLKDHVLNIELIPSKDKPCRCPNLESSTDEEGPNNEASPRVEVSRKKPSTRSLPKTRYA